MRTSFLPIQMWILTSLLVTSTLSVFASVPTSPPPSSSAPAGGYFSQYFTNLKSTPTPIAPTVTCSVDTVIIWFETTNLSTLFKPRCQNFSDLLSRWLSTYVGNLGIGTAANATHKLSVAGKVRATVQTVASDSADTLATKKYVDDNAGGGGGPVNFNCPPGQFVSGFSSTWAAICTGPSYLYQWEVSAYGACSVTCGGGTQSRVVRCKRSDGFYPDDSYCAETKPDVSQACGTLACGYRITNFTTYGWGGWRANPLWVHKRCVATNVWADWNDKTQYSLWGSDNANWSMGISDEWGRNPAYANVMCTDDFPGGSLTDGVLCTHAGRPGIMKSGWCYVWTYYSDRYSTHLNNITNSVGRWWAGVGTPP